MTRYRPEATFPALIRANAAADPHAIAIIEGDRQITFGEFDEAMIGSVQALMAFGVKPGDRVGIWAPNSIEWLVAAVGVLGAGGILLPINGRLRGAEVADILTRSSATAVFTVRRFLGMDHPAMLRQAAPDLKAAIIDLSSAGEAGAQDWTALLAAGAAKTPRAEAIERIAGVRPGDICDVLYTSGTTGLPKGVVTTHDNTIHSACEYISILGLTSTDRLLLIPPLGLMFGLKYIFLLGVLARATIVMQPMFDARSTMELMSRHRITYLPGPPTLIQEVLESPVRGEYDLSALKRVLLAGTYVQPALVLRIREENFVEEVFVGYGLSEAAAVAMTRADDDAERVIKTVGSALPGVRIRVADEHGVDVPIGQPGEILVRSPWVMDGYFNDPALTDAAFIDGWLKTGDLGILDDHGYLTMSGRQKDMYIAGGFNVYPAEVETCLMDHGSLLQVAVVPRPDDRLGEVGVAFVVPKTPASFDPDGLTAWAKARLAGYKVPRAICVLDALPMNASSKILRDDLRARAAALSLELRA